MKAGKYPPLQQGQGDGGDLGTPRGISKYHRHEVPKGLSLSSRNHQDAPQGRGAGPSQRAVPPRKREQDLPQM